MNYSTFLARSATSVEAPEVTRKRGAPADCVGCTRTGFADSRGQYGRRRFSEDEINSTDSSDFINISGGLHDRAGSSFASQHPRGINDMRINVDTRISGRAVILVPYRKKHVERYHLWMKSPELQHLTGSEPLTLEEEYSMQKSWQEDENKCTFIVLDSKTFAKTSDEIESMIGDTNLYLNDTDEPRTAECEIMIAEEAARGRKIGWEAMILMFRYGIDLLKINKYRAKIKLDNAKSISMFVKLRFSEVSRSEVFQEITMEKEVDDEWTEWLMSETPESHRDIVLS